MSIEDIVRAWKADEETLESNIPTNPIGDELSDLELQEVTGGAWTQECDTADQCTKQCFPFVTWACPLGISH